MFLDMFLQKKYFPKMCLIIFFWGSYHIHPDEQNKLSTLWVKDYNMTYDTWKPHCGNHDFSPLANVVYQYSNH